MVVGYDWLMKTYARVFVCLQLKYFFSRLVANVCCDVIGYWNMLNMNNYGSLL